MTQTALAQALLCGFGRSHCNRKNDQQDAEWASTPSSPPQPAFDAGCTLWVVVSGSGGPACAIRGSFDPASEVRLLNCDSDDPTTSKIV
jgi:hypothetical protein